MNGLIIINKEKDYTSRDVVNVLSKTFNMSQIGHTGTLDPIATGVLVLAIGNALKRVEFLTNETKEYEVEVKFGIHTDTLDITGNVLDENYNYSISEDSIIRVLNTFIGESYQEVPIYSAIRVKGQRLYKYARNNMNVELPKRKIEIYDIKLLEFKNDMFSFKVKVSKGTYIRSLVRDIGIKLNILCCMNNLRRIKQGVFDIKDSYTLEAVKNGKYKIIDSDIIFDNYKKIKVDSFIEKKIMNGRILENRYKEFPIIFINEKDKVLGIYDIYSKDETKIKPIKIFK